MAAPPRDPSPEALTELALRASGYSEAERPAAEAALEAVLSPIVERVRGIREEDARARALLQALHRAGGPLARYESRSTTLRDVLENQTFNCLSSAVLYNIAAERVGLVAFAELLPTHARSQLLVLGQNVAVETTSAHGYNPDAETQRRILELVAGTSDPDARALVPKAGAIVANQMLVGAMYVNRASIAQENGDLQHAQALFGRGEALAMTDDMRSILRDQRAALLSQLAGTDAVSGEPERILRGYQTIGVAVSLRPEDRAIKEAVFRNLRAAAERVIVLHLDAGHEDQAERVVREVGKLGLAPAEQAGLRAFWKSELSRLFAERGDIDGAVAAIEAALRERLSTSDAMLKVTLEQNHLSALRVAALTSAKRGDYDESMRIIERIGSLSGLTRAQRQRHVEDRLKAYQLVAQAKFDAGDLVGAAAVYRDARVHYPNDETIVHNLSSILQRLSSPEVDRGHCEQAAKYLDEIRTLVPESKFPRKARVRCWMIRANDLLERGEHSEAVALLGAAFGEAPDDKLVHQNLALVLLHWIRADRAAACPKAKRLARELSAAGAQPKTQRYIDRILTRCR